jgi:hypothetical protein
MKRNSFFQPKAPKAAPIIILPSTGHATVGDAFQQWRRRCMPLTLSLKVASRFLTSARICPGREPSKTRTLSNSNSACIPIPCNAPISYRAQRAQM